MLRRIIGELKRRRELPGEIPDRPDRLQAEFGNWLGAAGAKRRVVLVIDALNQLEDRDGIAELFWLPQTHPANVCVIVSALPGAALDEVVRRGWPSLCVEPLRREEREALVVGYLGRYSKSLSAGRLRTVVEAEPTSNPLYLRRSWRSSRVFGVHEQLDERLAYYLAAVTPEELLHANPAALTNRTTTRIVLAWSATRCRCFGPPAEDLASRSCSSCSEVEAIRCHVRTGAPLALAAESMLVNRSGLLRFSHDFIREAVRQRYLPRPRDEHACHRRLAGHFGRPGLGRDRSAWTRAVACVALVIVTAGVFAGLIRLSNAIAEGPTEPTTFERLLLIPPAGVARVLSAVLGVWTIWGLARVIRWGSGWLPVCVGRLRRWPAGSSPAEPSSLRGR